MAIYRKNSNGTLELYDSPFVKLTQNDLFPVGYVYIQFPESGTPSDINLPGTWQEISSNYAGYFFRFEGGRAADFLDCQYYATCYCHFTVSSTSKSVSHCHTYCLSCRTGSGYTSACGTKNRFCDTSVSNISCSGAHCHYVYIHNNVETRPKNTAVRLWRRVS